MPNNIYNNIFYVRWGKFVVTFLKFLRLVLFGDKKWRNFYVHAALKNMCIDQIKKSQKSEEK